MIEETPESQERAQLTAARALHRPRRYGRAGYGSSVQRCVTCAVFHGGDLRREDWPCRTAVALGIDA